MKARGFAIVTALFILVVLALLGSYVVNIITGMHRGQTLDLLGVQAQQAARAGVEWGLYKQQRDHSCTGSTSLSLAGTTLADFAVTVQCADVDGVAHIVATACNQPHGGACPNETSHGDFYVERRLEVYVR
ncbi:conserved exported protein of unknown function [Sterolibacterium denitrificans]|uniref:Agglutinin biogenesis protein MshP n=1 Tax=Sterolibacterium denitrificans TaxID=157592 RepID=A0A7Z7HQY2_9PROT|nr:agglutinin biogenesis protein MshP [Sterolibacterium denitrificans]SMB24124.1 conserved exported protein of unknown function [Sterolibacterium denitrificans]